MFFNENAIKNKIQTYKNRVWEFVDHMTHGKLKEEEEKRIDEELKQTFPASDSPAHRSQPSGTAGHIH